MKRLKRVLAALLLAALALPAAQAQPPGATPVPVPAATAAAAETEEVGVPISAEDRALAAERSAHFDAMPYSERMVLSLKLCVLGMVVVMIVLWLIAAVVGWLNRLDIASQAEIADAEPEVAEGAPIETIAGLQPEIAAVITAAVAATVGTHPFVLRDVRLSTDPGHAWGVLGRAGIQASHSLERKH